MTLITEQRPQGDFDVLDCSMTLAQIADELAKSRELCLPGCSIVDARHLEMVSAPYGYDVVFVPNRGSAGANVGDTYLKRRVIGVEPGDGRQGRHGSSQ